MQRNFTHRDQEMYLIDEQLFRISRKRRRTHNDTPAGPGSIKIIGPIVRDAYHEGFASAAGLP